MASPLSSRPTPFRIEVEGRRAFFGNCVWDALGIPAMLGADAGVETACADCDEPLSFRVREGRLEPVEAVAHFAVPARRWWDDIGYT